MKKQELLNDIKKFQDIQNDQYYVDIRCNYCFYHEHLENLLHENPNFRKEFLDHRHDDFHLHIEK